MKRELSSVALLVLCATTGCTREGGEEVSGTHADVAGPPQLKADAEHLKHTVVTPQLEEEMHPGKNILWCGTFQLAWNELCRLSGGPIEMADAPPVVAVLNANVTTKYDLDTQSYVAVAGLGEEGVYDTIRRELQSKFPGQASPDLLESVPEMDWVAYAYLFKSLPFQYAFRRFHGKLDFQGVNVDAFGIDQFYDGQEDESKMASQVVVIDHNGNDDFIVELKTRAEDEKLYLAKINPGRTLAETIAAVDQRIEKAKPTAMREMEDLLVPVLDFDVLRNYSELVGKKIKSSDPDIGGTPIVVAAQSIRFRLDERGAVLKSEAIELKGAGLRNLVFDKPFLILLKRRGAKNPYFALWVANPELLVPSKSSD